MGVRRQGKERAHNAIKGAVLRRKGGGTPSSVTCGDSFTPKGEAFGEDAVGGKSAITDGGSFEK